MWLWFPLCPAFRASSRESRTATSKSAAQAVPPAGHVYHRPALRARGNSRLRQGPKFPFATDCPHRGGASVPLFKSHATRSTRLGRCNPTPILAARSHGSSVGRCVCRSLRHDASPDCAGSGCLRRTVAESGAAGNLLPIQGQRISRITYAIASRISSPPVSVNRILRPA